MSRSSNPSPEILRRLAARAEPESEPAPTLAEGFRRAAIEKDYRYSLGASVAKQLHESRIKENR